MLQWKQTRFSQKAEADNRFSTSDLKTLPFTHSPVMPFFTATIFPLHQLLPEPRKKPTSALREGMNQFIAPLSTSQPPAGLQGLLVLQHMTLNKKCKKLI